jgi:hypothetical protein
VTNGVAALEFLYRQDRLAEAKTSDLIVFNINVPRGTAGRFCAR